MKDFFCANCRKYKKIELKVMVKKTNGVMQAKCRTCVNKSEALSMTSIIKTRVTTYDSSIDHITVLRNLAKTRTSADLARMFNVPPTTMSSYCARYGVYCLQIDRETRGKLGYAKGIGKQRAA